MSQLSGKLDEIVKPMVQNEMQQSNELDERKVHAGENLALSMPKNP